MKKSRRMLLSFSKAELGGRCSVSMHNAGIMLAMPADKESAKSYMASFGWGSDTNKYYPGLNVQSDLMPKDEDFVNVPFRMLSATMVAAGTWRSTDFTDTKVLSASVPKLKDKPVYKEHDTDLDNWVGLVRTPKFSPEFTMTDGTRIPAGIDAIVSIDGKTNPKIARAVLVGGIYSNSVTVEFDWVPSHDFAGDDAEDQFERAVGQIIDGRMVCRKVTNIIDYYESSLVWLGADPYAKQITPEGDLIHVDESSTYEDDNTVQTKYKQDAKYSMKLGIPKNLLSLSKKENLIQNNNPQKPNTMTLEEILAALRLSLGLPVDAEVTKEQIATLSVAPAVVEEDTTELAQAVTELTGEVIEGKQNVKELTSKLAGFKGIKVDKLTALEATAKTVETLTAEKTSLTSEVVNLKADKATLEAKIVELNPKAAIADKFIQDKKAECKRLYNLSVNNKPVDAVIALIEKGTVEELDGLIGTYTKGLTENFSGKCKDCGSANFEFKSSVGGEDPTKDKDENTSDVSFEAIHQRFDKKTLGK